VSTTNRIAEPPPFFNPLSLLRLHRQTPRISEVP
jgi:hypothetical protein